MNLDLEVLREILTSPVLTCLFSVYRESIVMRRDVTNMVLRICPRFLIKLVDIRKGAII